MRRRSMAHLIPKKKSQFVLQLTAMVDMFTILLVFLLKSFSTSAEQITPEKGVELPLSNSIVHATDAVKLTLSKEGVFFDSHMVSPLNRGQFAKADIDRKDPSFIPSLYKVMDKYLEEKKKKGDIPLLIQADSNLSYLTLKKVMYTSSLVGFHKIKLATIAKE